MKLAVGIPARRARFEIVPLIDCVFLVLVVFIYSTLSMVVRRGLPVELPTATYGAVSTEAAIVITLAADGTITMDGETIARDDLAVTLRVRSAPADRAGVVLSADAATPHQSVVSVMDALRAGGVERVLIRTEPRRGNDSDGGGG